MSLENELKIEFPLFDFEIKEMTTFNGSANRLMVTYKNRSIILDLKDLHKSKTEIRSWHSDEYAAKMLMERHKNLVISVHTQAKGQYANVWIKRDNKDAEGFKHPPLPLWDSETHLELLKLDLKARMAKREGWFFCCGHQRSEEVSDRMYYWFSGRYCEDYGKENPAHREAAETESYN